MLAYDPLNLKVNLNAPRRANLNTQQGKKPQSCYDNLRKHVLMEK